MMIPLNKWHERFLNLADEVKTWSKDPRCQVGAVIISPDRKQISYGFNGFPSKINDDNRLHSDHKNDLMIHAEINAILNAKKDVQGWTLYCTKLPCVHCALAIIQAGIIDIFSYEEMNDASSWKVSQKKAKELFAEAKINLTTIPRK